MALFSKTVLALCGNTSGMIVQGYFEVVIYRSKKMYPKNGDSVIETIR